MKIKVLNYAVEHGRSIIIDDVYNSMSVDVDKFLWNQLYLNDLDIALIHAQEFNEILPK